MSQLRPSRIPTSTYRLQLHGDFTLEQATELVDYCYELGIGACYISPILRARSGSLHGYDILDHTLLNPELGSPDPLAQLQRFAHRLGEVGMGLLLDVVPNHMCISEPENVWWWNVLENGPSSPFAHFFDIDWHPPKPDLTNKVLLPILGDQYGRVMENQEIRVNYEGGAFYVSYYEKRLPLEPRSWRAILKPVLFGAATKLGEADEHVLELASTITALKNLPRMTELGHRQVTERQREKEIIKRRLATLLESSAAIRAMLDEVLEGINGKRGVSKSFDALESLLSQQAFRLSFWRVASDEINYRRFFDINELAAIRVEEPSVFEEVHALIFRLLEQGLVTGFRIDHVDGLADPKQYLERIQGHCQAVLAEKADGASGERMGYVVVEKILMGQERLRADWPVAGTTGYEFLNLLNGLFIDLKNRRRLIEIYRRFTGDAEDLEDVFYESKKLVLSALMSSELQVLARKLDRISEQHRWSRDFTANSLKQALLEVVACFPVYRTYIRASDAVVSSEDRLHVAMAIRRAKRRNPSTSATIFDFIAALLLHQAPEGLSENELFERRDFVTRLQQLTSPVMAKGIEDTAFYRFYPLASVNEVGGGPQWFGIPVQEFHRQCSERLSAWPHGLSTTSTHDTKRGEDVRARINVLSEIPEQWEAAIERWRVLNQPKRKQLQDREAPSASEEYLLYQTLIGAWPSSPPAAALSEKSLGELGGRLQAYMTKAIKEAKVNTSWINPDEEYEQAIREFVAAILNPAADNAFLQDFVEFGSGIFTAGMWTSLSQVLLKLTAPGVPDLYQGSELWDLNLVDPDNRRPVDYALRRTLLEQNRRESLLGPAACCDDLMEHPESGRIKLYTISRTLELRRAQAELFAAGAYEPLAVTGERENHVIAFARSLAERQVVSVAARFFTALGTPGRLPVGAEVWRNTELALPAETTPVTYREVFTDRLLQTEPGAKLPLAEALKHLPVALLVRQL